MALIICTECSREFSDKAPACPKCGCPVEVARETTATPRNFVAPTISAQRLSLLWIQRVIYVGAMACCFLPWMSLGVKIESHVNAGDYGHADSSASSGYNYSGMVFWEGWSTIILAVIGLCISFRSRKNGGTRMPDVVPGILMAASVITTPFYYSSMNGGVNVQSNFQGGGISGSTATHMTPEIGLYAVVVCAILALITGIFTTSTSSTETGEAQKTIKISSAPSKKTNGEPSFVAIFSVAGGVLLLMVAIDFVAPFTPYMCRGNGKSSHSVVAAESAYVNGYTQGRIDLQAKVDEYKRDPMGSYARTMRQNAMNDVDREIPGLNLGGGSQMDKSLRASRFANAPSDEQNEWKRGYITGGTEVLSASGL